MIATFLLFWLPGFPATKNEKPKHTFVSFGMSGLTILKPVIYSLEIKWRAMQSTTGYWPFFMSLWKNGMSFECMSQNNVSAETEHAYV